MNQLFKLSLTDVIVGAVRLNPMCIIERLARRSGGFGRIAKMGERSIWVVSDPALLQRILVTNAKFFDRGGPIYDTLAQRNLSGNTGGILDGGPFTQNNLEDWQSERDVCNSYFQPSALNEAAEQVVQLLESSMLGWKPEDDISLLPVFKNVSLGVLSHHLFGGKIDELTTAAIESVAPRYFGKMAWQLVLGMLPTKRLTGWNSYEKVGEQFSAILEDIITCAQDQPDEFEGTLLGDLLQTFDASSPKEHQLIKGTIGTFYLAGFDSTATVTAQACIALAKNPALQARIRAESNEVFGQGPVSPEKLEQLHHTRAFWQLMLHKHTAFRVIFRNVVTSCELGGQLLASGDQLLLGLQAAHQNPQCPITLEDFMGKLTSQQRLGHLPYGAGSRKCIGAPLADIQGPLTIATLLREWELRRPSPNLGGLRGVAMTSPLVDSRVTILRPR